MVDSRTKKALVTFGAAALLTLGALPAAAQDEAPLLYVINKSADQQYFIDLQTSFEAKATELGATALKADAKLDPSLGVSLVNDAISAGAKGIAITVPDQTIGPAISDAAKAAGVALVATDDGIVDSEGNPVPFVGFSGPDMGAKVGAEAARLLTEGGWLEDRGRRARRPLHRGPDAVGLRGPHQRLQAGHARRRRRRRVHLPGPLHR